ncbi:unnamed protein product, partial [Allacma fusca]
RSADIMFFSSNQGIISTELIGTGILLVTLSHFKFCFSQQRYFICDPYCVERKCHNETEDIVCVYIMEIKLSKVEFANECAFNCANRCYENQLLIYNKGPCPVTEGAGPPKLPQINEPDPDDKSDETSEK